MGTSEKTENHKNEGCPGSPKMNPTSYQSKMKQNNSMEFFGYSFNKIYNKDGPPDQTPQTPNQNFPRFPQSFYRMPKWGLQDPITNMKKYWKILDSVTLPIVNPRKSEKIAVLGSGGSREPFLFEILIKECFLLTLWNCPHCLSGPNISRITVELFCSILDQ